MREFWQNIPELFRKYGKSFLVTFLCLLLAAGAILTALFLIPSRQEDAYPAKISVYYFDRKVTGTREDMLRDGVLYLDFGELSRACGFHISGTREDVTVSSDAGDTVRLRNGDNVADVNGTRCRMEAEALVDGADIHLPLSFVGQYLTGLQMEWNQDRSELYLSRQTDSGAILSFSLKEDSVLGKISSAGVHVRISVEDAELDYTFVTDVTPYLRYMNPEDRDAYLLFLSPTTPCKPDYEPAELTAVKNVPKGTSQKMTECAAKALEAMLAEMEASSGIKNVNAVHAYVPYASQEKNFNNRVYNERYYFRIHKESEGTYFSDLAYSVLGKSYLNSAYISKGTYSLSAADAEKVAAKAVAAPGTSDHQTGLGTDLSYGKSADKSFAQTDAYAWLRENAYKFGFIERYPKDAEKMTGFAYEPYHWRFVGQYHAAIMHRDGYSCLDEYLAAQEYVG